MVPTRELGQQLYRQKVLAARAMTVEQRLIAGARLFSYACQVTSDGIRSQFPEASEEDVRRILSERLSLARRLEQRA